MLYGVCKKRDSFLYKCKRVGVQLQSAEDQSITDNTRTQLILAHICIQQWWIKMGHHVNYTSLKMGQPLLMISSILALICLWIFGGQSSAAKPFSFAARVDCSSSSSGKFPISWRRKGFLLSSNFCRVWNAKSFSDTMRLKTSPLPRKGIFIIRKYTGMCSESRNYQLKYLTVRNVVRITIEVLHYTAFGKA